MLEYENSNSLDILLEKEEKIEKRVYNVLRMSFDSEDEAINYCTENTISYSNISVLEYIRNFAGKSNVIKKTNSSFKVTYYSLINEYEYVVYNDQLSKFKGKNIWEYEYGNISFYYQFFKNRNIIFEKGSYKEIDDNNTSFQRKLQNKYQNV